MTTDTMTALQLGRWLLVVLPVERHPNVERGQAVYELLRDGRPGKQVQVEMLWPAEARARMSVN